MVRSRSDRASGWPTPLNASNKWPNAFSFCDNELNTERVKPSVKPDSALRFQVRAIALSERVLSVVSESKNDDSLSDPIIHRASSRPRIVLTECDVRSNA